MSLARSDLTYLSTLKPEDVISNRDGEVLIKHTSLKADHFPSCHNTKLQPQVEGAPNFRQIEGLPVYGVAIPTLTGLRNVLNILGAAGGRRKVFWQNLREEPLIFINGNPFVVREADKPFCNLEYTGIDGTRVADMETRLKQDILNEAKSFHNHILVVHENEDLSIYDHWEPVTQADVLTPREVYAELKADGYDVDYLRIPVTDEKAPKDKDFDVMVQRLSNVPQDAALIFNCQMGRGRTTTGIIIASLICLRRMGAIPVNGSLSPSVPEWFLKNKHNETLEDKLKAGMYGVVRSLLRALDKGPESKVILDCVIDSASQMQNLREAIASYRLRFLKEMRERQRANLLAVCLEYLERYYMLIAFTVYLNSNHALPDGGVSVTFEEWMAERPELRSILGRMLRRDALAALEVRSEHNGEAADAPRNQEESSQAVISRRSGAVLGPLTILKEDNFPGMRSRLLPQHLDGAPNYRPLVNFPVFGVGMPTTEGIMATLRCVQSTLKGKRPERIQALWINMREEPVVYVNGRPFVLREEERPLKNMMEYQGIDAERLEAMEARLKRDVLTEAAQFGARILVTRESGATGHLGELMDSWEEISGEDAVKTPAEVYASLKEQGMDVQFYRIPVTDGMSVTAEDIDQVLKAILDFGLDKPVIFNCQMGSGRTTMGMVIAGLVHLYQKGTMELTRQNSMDMTTTNFEALHEHLAGVSPRSEDEFRDEDDEVAPKIWDMEPEEVEEQRNLASAGYVAVRRVTRLLEEGDSAKKTLDAVIDSASDLINLRVAILKYRKPRGSYNMLRPEMQQRHDNFKRGAAYLERYCLLLAFTFYLERVGPENGQSFAAWLQSRPELTQALSAIHINPAAALAAVPVARIPAMYESISDEVMQDLRRVMAKRRGRTLTKRTILKSYQSAHEGPDGLPRIYQVEDMPIYSSGNLSISALRHALDKLGGGPGGNYRIMISDVREELAVYINGTPYTRRELEMPAAALHHAGIHYTQIEELETLLVEDVIDEAAHWGGRILLHREIAMEDGSTSGHRDDDVTGLVDIKPGSSVAPSWETVDPSNSSAIMTTRQVFNLLLSEGYDATYWRIPLSRERTPEAADLDEIHNQIIETSNLYPVAPGKQLRHLILSRTARGSSARFVASSFGVHYIDTSLVSPEKRMRSSSGMDPLLIGEYRPIMALCRLLPRGSEHKAAVDLAIQRCNQIGNVLADILKCKKVAEAAPAATTQDQPLMAQEAARQLALHYLKRYFLLIAYRCFLESGGKQNPSWSGFTAWVNDQRELMHLANNLTLDL